MRTEIWQYYVADTENTVPRSTLYDGSADEAYGEDTAPDPSTYKDPNKETNVWAWALCPVREHPTAGDVAIDTSVDDGMARLANTSTRNGKGKRVPITVFFHNLSYDGPPILFWLVNNGYKRDTPGEKQRTPARGRFFTVISDGAWYSITVKFRTGQVVIFRDSLKILPFSVDSIAHSLKTRAQKLTGTIDYTKPRPPGYEITDTERRYIENDVLVMSEALYKMEGEFPGYLQHLTIGSACMSEWKGRYSEMLSGVRDAKQGAQFYRQNLADCIDPDLDKELRHAYRGGWCYVNRDNPMISDNEIVDLRNSDVTGNVYDVNSLYPSAMYDKTFPTGCPHELDKSRFDSFNPMTTIPYIIKVNADFEIKDGYLPFIQLKTSGRFAENEYVKDSDGVESVTLTAPDFQLMLEHYHFRSVEIERVWLFDECHGIFDTYIDAWYAIKEQAGRDGNAVLRMIAKLYLNNLYGKMGQSAEQIESIPYHEGGVLHFLDEEADPGVGGYIPIGAYITAYARAVTVKAAQENYDTFLYADTDSIHVVGPAKGIEINGDKLGAWDHEAEWKIGRYVRQKCYIEYITSADTPFVDIKAAGANPMVKERLKYRVTYNEGSNYYFGRINRDEKDVPTNPKRDVVEMFERFAPGLRESGKLTRKQVIGGSVLYETTFSIHGGTNPDGGIDEPKWTVVE